MGSESLGVILNPVSYSHQHVISHNQKKTFGHVSPGMKMCYRIYRDSSYYPEVARFNDIADFRQVFQLQLAASGRTWDELSRIKNPTQIKQKRPVMNTAQDRWIRRISVPKTRRYFLRG